MRRHAPRAFDMIFLSWLMVVILLRFTVNCLLAARLLANGPSGAGQAVAEFSMLHFLAIVFLLPLLSSILSLGGAGLDRKRLVLGGTSFRSLALVELAGLAAHPITWVSLLFAVPAVVPLANLPAPGASLAALIPVSLAALLAARALGGVLSLGRTAHRLSGALRFVVAGTLLAILFSNPDFQWEPGGVRIFLFQHPALLMDGAGRGILGLFRPWCPSVWVFRGWVAPCAGLLAATLVLFVLSLKGTYHAAGEAAPSRRRRMGERPRARGLAAVIYRHELRYFAASPGGLAALGAGLMAGVWLIAARQPSVNITLLGGLLALAAGFTCSSNTFGHDGHALRRYALLGPDWGTIFAAKNRAWLTVMGLPVLVLAAADAARVSLSSGLSLLPGAGLVLVLSIVWGNLSSALLPSKNGLAQPKAFVNQAGPFALFAVPLAIHSMVAPFGSPGFAIATSICLAAALVVYVFLMRRISRGFDAEVERVLARF